MRTSKVGVVVVLSMLVTRGTTLGSLGYRTSRYTALASLANGSSACRRTLSTHNAIAVRYRAAVARLVDLVLLLAIFDDIEVHNLRVACAEPTAQCSVLMIASTLLSRRTRQPAAYLQDS